MARSKLDADKSTLMGRGLPSLPRRQATGRVLLQGGDGDHAQRCLACPVLRGHEVHRHAAQRQLRRAALPAVRPAARAGTAIFRLPGVCVSGTWPKRSVLSPGAAATRRRAPRRPGPAALPRLSLHPRATPGNRLHGRTPSPPGPAGRRWPAAVPGPALPPGGHCPSPLPGGSRYRPCTCPAAGRPRSPPRRHGRECPCCPCRHRQGRPGRRWQKPVMVRRRRVLHGRHQPLGGAPRHRTAAARLLSAAPIRGRSPADAGPDAVSGHRPSGQSAAGCVHRDAGCARIPVQPIRRCKPSIRTSRENAASPGTGHLSSLPPAAAARPPFAPPNGAPMSVAGSTSSRRPGSSTRIAAAR